MDHSENGPVTAATQSRPNPSNPESSLPRHAAGVFEDDSGAPAAPQGAPPAAGTYTPGPGPQTQPGPATQAGAPFAWHQLPAALRERAQWLLARPNEHAQFKVPVGVNAAGLCAGSSTDRHTWLDFDTALRAATWFGYGLGYVLAADDPFCCVDLDVKNLHNASRAPDTWTPQHHLDTMMYICSDLASYTEHSVSGQGVHVWVRAKIGAGIKSHGVEVYSQQRFIACTGNHVHGTPFSVEPRQEAIDVLVQAMRSVQGTRAYVLNGTSEPRSDEDVYRRAAAARNGGKFERLWRGEWQALGYPSQSEADAALLEMLWFHASAGAFDTEPEQVRRMFRHSALGYREKAQKNDRYLNYTLRLVRGTKAEQFERLAVLQAQFERKAQ